MAGYLGGNKYKGVAPALDALLGQLNARAPKRSKLSDGALGNAAHAASVSFHNPNPAGIVQARDYTHDPAAGLDTKWLAKALAQSGDPRILEIISNRQYWTPKGGWVPYTGTNPHDKHLHLSVRSEPALYNSTAPWNLGDGSTPAPEEDFMAALTDDEQRHLYSMIGETIYMLKPNQGPYPGPAGDVLTKIGAIHALLLAGGNGTQIDAATIAAAIPDDIAEQVAQKLADRLAS